MRSLSYTYGSAWMDGTSGHGDGHVREAVRVWLRAECGLGWVERRERGGMWLRGSVE